VSRGGGGGGGKGAGAYGSATAGGGSNAVGTANTGGGGSGNVTGIAAFAGGSGLVVISYDDTFADITTIPGGLTFVRTVTGGKKIYEFTAGTGTVTV
jgi:hypothetical protein